MNESIRAFGRALGAVMEFLVDQVFIPVQAHTANALEDLDNWLTAHNLTIAQLIGYIFMVMAGTVAAGGGIAFVGLLIGSTMSDHMVAISIARAMVIIGMIIGLLGFLPVAAVFMFTRRLYNLMFHTARAAAAMFADAENVNIPERLRQQLEAMLEARFSPVPPNILLISYLGAYSALALFPTLSSVMYVLLAGVFGYITYHLRNLTGVKGWALTHFCYALAMGGMWFATPAYFLAGWINSQQLVARHYTDPEYAFWTQVGFAALVLMLSVIPLYKTTRTQSSDEALDNGDVQRFEYKKRPVSLDNEGKPVYELVMSREFSWKWLKSPVLWLGVLAVVWFVWTQVLGHPGPINSLMAMSFKKMMLYGLVACGIMVVYGLLPDNNSN